MTNTDVVIVRVFVTRSTAPRRPALKLEVSCSIVSFTPLPSLICGVIFRLVPTSSRWIVWNGFTLPLLPLPVFVNCPVRNGTSWPTLISASSLSSVTICGVETMFVSASPRSAFSIAAQLVPLSRDLADAERDALRDRREARRVARGRLGEPEDAAGRAAEVRETEAVVASIAS